MRDAALAVIREIGVETGGSNIQFAVNPQNGRMIVIEMNPRVSRSSALASKATGFPIAKIAAKLAVGYTLDELQNDITARDAGLLRADHRLRRREGAALRVREVPRRRRRARPADEVGRRGDGDRPHVQGERSTRRCARSRSAAGASTSTRRPPLDELKRRHRARPAPIACGSSPRRCALGLTRGGGRSSSPDRPVVPAQLQQMVDEDEATRVEGAAARRRAARRRGGCWRAQAPGLLRPAAR